MKIKYLPFLIFLISACADDDGLTENLEQSFYQNSSISNNYPYVGSGSSIVFHRYFQEEDDPEIADDEYAEDFMFEVPGGTDVFDLDGQQLKNLPILFNQYCYCTPIDFVQFTDGLISGRRKGDLWELQVDVNFKQGYINEESGDTVIVNSDRKYFSGLFRENARP